MHKLKKGEGRTELLIFNLKENRKGVKNKNRREKSNKNIKDFEVII